MFLDENIARIKLSRTFYWMSITALTIYFLVQFKEFFQPFVLAVLFWFLIKDLSNLIGKLKIRGRSLPPWLRGLIAFGAMVGIILMLIEIFSTNVERIIMKTPEYERKFDEIILGLGEATRVENITERLEKRLNTIDLQSYLSAAVGTATSFFSDFLVIIIYIIFLLIEDTVFSKKMNSLFKDESEHQEFRDLMSRITKSVHTYLSAKTGISLLTGVTSYIILRIFGLDFPELWAFLIFILNYIPYIGSLIATFLPALFAVFQFNSLIYFVWVFASVEIIQLLVGNYIEPKVMGKSLNLSPLFVILSLSFWGMIWGVLGMVLSVPIIAIIMIILAEFPNTRNIAVIMSEKGNI